MTLAPVNWLRAAALLIFVVAWAVIAHLNSAGNTNPDLAAALAVTPVVAVGVVLLWRLGNRLWIALGGFTILGLLAWSWPALRQNIALLYYVQHLGTNLALATLFGRTLFGEGQSLVTQFALMAHSGVISQAQARYSRQVTVAWTIFFLATALISTLLFALDQMAAWSIFANLLTLPLVGLMFVAEHICRHRILPPADRSTVADTIRGYRTAMQQRREAQAHHP